MEKEEFIELAKKYQDLGWSVQEQLDDYLAGKKDELNPNAIKIIEDFIKTL